MTAAHRCRSGGTAILPASCPAMERSKNTMPAITRRVGIGVSFSAARTLSIIYLLWFAHSFACGFLGLRQLLHQRLVHEHFHKETWPRLLLAYYLLLHRFHASIPCFSSPRCSSFAIAYVSAASHRYACS